MIRLLSLGLAGVVATLAGGYLSTLWMKASPDPNKPAGIETIEFVKLDAVSVPIIRAGKVQGYVIARVAMGATASEIKRNRQALVVYASEAIYRAIYEDEAFDFSAMKTVQLAQLADRMSHLANARFGRTAVRQSSIESLGFVTQAEARDARRQ